jgi:hypothetical protein
MTSTNLSFLSLPKFEVPDGLAVGGGALFGLGEEHARKNEGYGENDRENNQTFLHF